MVTEELDYKGKGRKSAVTCCQMQPTDQTGLGTNPGSSRSHCLQSIYARRVFLPLCCCDCLAGLDDGWWRRLCLEMCSEVDRKLRGPLPALPSCTGEDRMGKTLAVSYPEKSTTLPDELQ